LALSVAEVKRELTAGRNWPQALRAPWGLPLAGCRLFRGPEPGSSGIA